MMSSTHPRLESPRVLRPWRVDRRDRPGREPADDFRRQQSRPKAVTHPPHEDRARAEAAGHSHECRRAAAPRAMLPRTGRGAPGLDEPNAPGAGLLAPDARWPIRIRPDYPTTPGRFRPTGKGSACGLRLVAGRGAAAGQSCPRTSPASPPFLHQYRHHVATAVGSRGWYAAYLVERHPRPAPNQPRSLQSGEATGLLVRSPRADHGLEARHRAAPVRDDHGFPLADAVEQGAEGVPGLGYCGGLHNAIIAMFGSSTESPFY